MHLLRGHICMAERTVSAPEMHLNSQPPTKRLSAAAMTKLTWHWAGAGRNQQARELLQGKCLHCRDGREVPKSPFHHLGGSRALSLPALVSAACSSFSDRSPSLELTEPISATVCSALPCRPLLALGAAQGHRRVCRCFGPGDTEPAETEHGVMVISMG